MGRASDDRALKQIVTNPITCPCCGGVTTTPTIDVVIDVYKIPPQQGAILRAVWKGRGHLVATERIFDFMYADDPDGGPEPAKMYRYFKTALCLLRQRLAGSGIGIECPGRGRGYRLVIGGK